MEWISSQFSSLMGYSEAEQGPSNVEDASGSKQSQGRLSRSQLLRFFESGTVQLQSESLRQRLKDAQFLNQDLEDIVTAAQKKLFEEQGIDGDFGVAYLGKVNTDYKDDDEVIKTFLQFVSLEEDALAEAELSPEMYAQNQRLMEVAKGHAAELMAHLKELPPDERQQFLAQQMQAMDKLKMQTKLGHSSTPASAMTDLERTKFFKSMQKP